MNSIHLERVNTNGGQRNTAGADSEAASYQGIPKLTRNNAEIVCSWLVAPALSF